MAEFGDSLVVRILADGSQFQQAMSEAIDRLDELESRVQRMAGASGQFQRLGTAVSALTSPLQSVARGITQVQTLADALGRTVINLNVGPALSALASLSAAISAIQTQLQAISLPMGGFMPFGMPSGTMPGGGVRRFAEGGLVAGPTGIDKVPAMLSAGEFVLNRDAVRQLGLPFLQQVNQTRDPIRQLSAPRDVPVNETNIHTQFGGVTIQLQQTGELSAVIDSLALEEIHLRNRWG